MTETMTSEGVTSIYDKWAEALTGFSVDVKPGQTVYISGGVAAEPLFKALHHAVLRRGGYPIIVPTLSGLGADLLKNGTDEQLTFLTPLEEYERTKADVNIRIMAETNTKSLSGADPARQALFQGARRELFETYLQRAADGTLDWTLTLFPTDAYAQDAEMSTEEYANFVYRACKLDQPDPIAAWKQQGADQQHLIDWLAGKSEIHLTGPDTDLTVNVGGRTWVNSDGRRNFPSGEIFTGPVENSAEGHVRFSYPVVVSGREVQDVRLTFQAGKVVEATAAQNEEFLIKQLDTDAGARYLGEFAFGTNFGITQFTKNILFDEKIGGTVHMAVGSGYPETGSTNRSAVHWDFICDLRQGRVTVDGEVFAEGGQFVV